MEAWENGWEGPAQGEERQEKERGGHVAGFGDSFNSGCIVLKVVAFFLNMAKIKLHVERGDSVGCRDYPPVKFLRHRGVTLSLEGLGGGSDEMVGRRTGANIRELGTEHTLSH